MSQISNNEQYQHYKELLSCLSDGELLSHELEVLMSGLQKYPELNAYWQRLQVKNSVLKNGYEHPMNMQWLDKIRSSLNVDSLDAHSFDTATESAQILSFSQAPTKTSSKKEKSKETFSGFTNFAIAASVMLFVVTAWLGSQAEVRDLALAYLQPTSSEATVNSDENSDEKQQVNEQISNTQIAMTRNINANNKLLASAGNISTEPSETVNDLYLSKPRIQDYMLLHAENASLNTNQGLLPFARMNRVSSGNQF
jgi:negative regulator of sigma E activity